jgi:hypothetical protein
MTDLSADGAATLLDLLLDELAERLAPRLVRMNETEQAPAGTPWLTTLEAIKYTRLPAGTFRKLSACGRIPAHGGRAKLFFRPELDQALLDFHGLADEGRTMRQVS